MLADQTAITATSGYLQPKGANFVSNLNPYAKEFYPSRLKSWRLKEDSDSKIKEPQLKIYSVLEGPQEEKVQVFHTTQELMGVKYNSTMHSEIYETRISDTKTENTKLQSKIAKPDLQRNIPTTMDNVQRLRKPLTGGSNTKPNCLATSVKSTAVPQRNSNILKLSSGIQPPVGSASTTSSNVTTKSKLVTKSVHPKLVLDGSNREMSSKSPNKDCLSIKSGTSSDKSSSSIKVNSSSNKIATTPDKPNTTRPQLQNRTTSKTLEKSGASSKPKPVAIKSPRGTVASTLRKTETQKRRNLFPYDPVLNIEMSEFLFK